MLCTCSSLSFCLLTCRAQQWDKHGCEICNSHLSMLLQVMQLSAGMFSGITDQSHIFWSKTETGVLVMSALRGSGLLASPVGILTAPAACEKLVRACLRNGSIGTLSDHMLAGVRVGRLCDVAPPGMVTLEALQTAAQHGLKVLLTASAMAPFNDCTSTCVQLYLQSMRFAS